MKLTEQDLPECVRSFLKERNMTPHKILKQGSSTIVIHIRNTCEKFIWRKQGVYWFRTDETQRPAQLFGQPIPQGNHNAQSPRHTPISGPRKNNG